MDKKSYFDSVLNYIDKLSDEQFDDLLIESGIENCPYENFTKKITGNKYESVINFSSSISISKLEGFNIFTIEGDAA